MTYFGSKLPNKGEDQERNIEAARVRAAKMAQDEARRKERKILDLDEVRQRLLDR